MASAIGCSAAGALRRLPRLPYSGTRSSSYSTKSCRFDENTLKSRSASIEQKMLEQGAKEHGTMSGDVDKLGEKQSTEDKKKPGWLSANDWTSIHIGGKDLNLLTVGTFLWELADKFLGKDSE